jgi:hypothetical protein
VDQGVGYRMAERKVALKGSMRFGKHRARTLVADDHDISPRGSNNFSVRRLVGKCAAG